MLSLLTSCSLTLISFLITSNINQYPLPNLHWVYSESFVADLPSSGADILFKNLITVIYFFQRTFPLF
jgi:hypothetical protein